MELKYILKLKFIDGQFFFLIVGFCVIEGEDMVFEIVGWVNVICERLEIFYIFKGFYCKVNCFCIDFFIGIGDEKVFGILKVVGEKF